MIVRTAYETALCGLGVARRLQALVGAVLLLLALTAAPARADVLPKEFLGKFRGSIIGSVGEIKGDFNMEAAANRNGFTMKWRPNGLATFETTDQKNVFHSRAGGELMEGAPAFWARLSEGKLLVYSMRIDSHGGFDIYTFIYAPVEEGLDMTVRHLRSGSGMLESKALLKRHAR